MTQPAQYHKAAVQSGQWLLYRHDPRNAGKQEPILSLDSAEPCLQVKYYLEMEKRFSIMNTQSNSDDIIESHQDWINRRYSWFKAKSSEKLKSV